ncbi:MAG: hypothetical protein AAGC55_22535, partial [Myxococcota bacterium]
MSDARIDDLDAFRRDFEDHVSEVDARRDAAVADISPIERARLALIPWLPESALVAVGISDATVAQLIELGEVRRVQLRPALIGFGGQSPETGHAARIEMPRDRAQRTVATLLVEHGLDWLRAQLMELGQSLDQVGALDPALARWAALARLAHDPDRAGQQMAAQVAHALDEDRPYAALAGVDTGRSLKAVLGTHFAAELARAGRRIGIFQRRELDHRQLVGYVPQHAEIAVFGSLLDRAPDRPWAVHYRGDGGVGKTMLVRYLTSKVCADRRLPVARVDFDHLDPQFPRTRPHELLVRLADELRLFDAGDSRQSHFAWSNLDSVVAALDELVDLRSGSRLTVYSRMVRDLVSALAIAMTHLPSPDGRCVVVLDTCEELERLRGPRTPRDAVPATFQLLEDLREQLRAYRVDLVVVLAGRRDLAERRYLRVVEMRGLAEDEARALIADRLGGDIERRRRFEPAILDACRVVPNETHDGQPATR